MSTSSSESEEESLSMQLSIQFSFVRHSIDNSSASSSLPNEARPGNSTSSSSFNMEPMTEANLSSGETWSINLMESSQMPDMKKEINRQKSYRHWSVLFMNPHRLAAAGFYYVGINDIVKCAFCGIHVDNWEEGDDPFKEHQKWSFCCDFIRGFPVGNVPISPNSANETVAIGEANNNSDALTTLEVRSFSVPERESSDIYQRREPAQPEYNANEAHLQSYESWPFLFRHEREQLNEPEFSSAGGQVCSKHFDCSDRLKDEKDNDDPQIKYAAKYPKHTYADVRKGHKFIGKAKHKKEGIHEPARPSTIQKEESTSHSAARDSSSLASEARPSTSTSSTSFNMEPMAEANLSSGETWSVNPMESREMPDMKKEINRLKSYKNWSVPFMNPHRLAAAGFYYAGINDIVKCPFCSIYMLKWKEGDDPFKQHQNLSLNCGFLRGFAVGNVPISANSANETFATGEANNNSDALTTLEVRSFSVPEREPVRVNRPVVNLGMQGIYQRRGPAQPEYNANEAHRQSYESWPSLLRRKPEQFTEPGFSSPGGQVCSKHFDCSDRLKDEKDNDDPQINYPAKYPKHTHADVLKGHKFIGKAKHKKEGIHEPARPSPILKEESTSNSTASVQQIENNNSSNASRLSNDARLCQICFVNPRGILFIPCGHVVCCVKCALSLSQCPVCCSLFTYIVKAFLP